MNRSLPELDVVGVAFDVPPYCCQGGGTELLGSNGGGGIPICMPGLNDPMLGGRVTSGGARPPGGGTGAGVQTDDGMDICNN